jgi:Mycothiol maleylpyruvate isomerase N-terminal domain
MANEAIVERLVGERARLFEALEAVAPESMTTPGLVGEWSARELIAHLGYWAGNATEAIQTAEQGPNEPTGDADERTVDEINETVARVARLTDLATVRRREAASFEALVERVGALDPALLSFELPDGNTLEEAIRVDGDQHYGEHANELRRILSEHPRG